MRVILLSQLRDTRTFEEKYNFVMGLNKEGVCHALQQYEKKC